MVASFTFHPGGKDSPGGTSNMASPASRVRISTVAPPGVPLAGSSRLPIGGKRKFGSFDTKMNFCLPDGAIFKINLMAEIGWSAARAMTANANSAQVADPIESRLSRDIVLLLPTLGARRMKCQR
jgi:hypothetical protein